MRLRIKSFLRDDSPIAVVGVGGTGSFVAEGLCRILPASQPLILIDHDTVEEHNLGRQNFYKGEVGEFKSKALAERLARRYGREVAYSVYPFDRDVVNEQWGKMGIRVFNGLIIGCVDNAYARIRIADTIKQTGSGTWWLDSGNGKDSGQLLIGSVTTKEGMMASIDLKEGVARNLPAPSLQMPELLVPVTEPERPLDCAQRVAADDQSPTINQMMAVLAVDMVRRFLAQSLTWMGLYVDLENGCLNPAPITPEALGKIVGFDSREIEKAEKMLLKSNL